MIVPLAISRCELQLTAMNVVTTDIYDIWFRKLKRKDPRTAARIQMRVDRLTCGNPGDAEPVGGGLSDYGSTTTRATGSTTGNRATCC